MSRFARNVLDSASERPATQRPPKNGRSSTVIHSPHDTPEEVDHSLLVTPGTRARRRRPQPLRFFPHHFPVPNTLYGILMVTAGTLLLGVLMLDVREVLSPVVLATLTGVMLWPFRSEPKIRPLLVVGAIVLVLWIAVASFSVLLPFIIAFILAYIVDPIVTKLQRRFYIKRWILALVVTLMLVALMAVAVGYMIPVLIAQLGLALGSIDKLTDSFVQWARGGGMTSTLGIPPEKAKLIVERYVVPRITGLESMVFAQASEMSSQLPGAVTSILSTVTNVLMVPFLMFYLIKDYWTIRASIYSFIPQTYQIRSQRMLNDMHEVVGGFLRGDLITSLFQGLFIGVGLTIIGVPGALLLGVLTGFLSLIPFIGGIIAFVIALISALAMPDPGVGALWVTALFAAQSIIETTIVGPHVMGRHTDLHPLIIMSSLLLFGYFMGLGGMIIAIPVTGLLMRGANRWRDKRRALIELAKVEADLAENPHHASKGQQPEVPVNAMAGPKAPLP